MLFNSYKFIAFFVIVCLVYFLLPNNRKIRNGFLLVASYYFYMCWEPIYALLILTSTVITYFCGILVGKNAGNKKKQKTFLISSLIINFAILFVFKYYNFINDSVFAILNKFGIQWHVPGLKVLLPVGISFYTFQAVGYSIDVYKGKLEPEKNFGIYALFVSFFPQLVAGPIERPLNMLHQFYEEHRFDIENVVAGMKMMLWGFFKKIVIADRLATYVDVIYNNPQAATGSSMLLATFFFAIQIYCDFSGYSDIAIGCAKCLDFKLMQNFRTPYFSNSIGTFWKRWHISLSSWFGEYVYIPLGGNRVKYWRWVFNIFVVFILSGMWHGANWTFIVWGALHGFYYMLEKAVKQGTHKLFGDFEFKSVFKVIPILLIFIMVMLAWIFFRANSIGDAWYILSHIFTDPFSKLWLGESQWATLLSLLMVFILFFIEYLQEKGIASIYFSESKVPRPIRWAWYLFMLYAIAILGVSGNSFIYFQF